MSAVLDKSGLELLINQIQSDTLRVETIQNYDASQNPRFFFKIKKHSSHWIIKYKITSYLEEKDSYTQISDVSMGGYGNEISYFETNNIVYDEGMLSCNYHKICVGEDCIYFGLDLSNREKLHSVKIEINSLYNCSVKVFDSPIQLSDITESIVLIKNIDFNKNGTVSNNASVDNLAKVATTGDYDDLINKPLLLKVNSDEQENEILFFLE